MPQIIQVNINHRDVLASQEYTSVPHERLVANKVQRAVKQYVGRGWSLDKIDFQNNDTVIHLRHS
jgi:hypothetical protein